MPLRPSRLAAPSTPPAARRDTPARAGCGAVLAWAALLVAAATLGPASAGADNLISVQELDRVREAAERGIEPMAAQRAAIVSAAGAPWAWGSVSGEFVTTVSGTSKRCHPASEPGRIDLLKEGAPDAYAKVLAYWVSTDRPRDLADQARQHVLDLVDTTGFRGLGGDDQSASNQCALELAISIPVWIETAQLLEPTPVFDDADRQAFAQWLAREVYPRVAWASRERRNNWGAAGSTAASLIADYVDGIVPTLVELSPVQRTLTPAAARAEHDAMQLARIGTTWPGDTRCPRAGIQPHGGIPDELRRGAAGCEATFLPSDEDSAITYQTMHVELLVIHAEAQRRRGDRTLFEARVPGGTPAILQAILFVIDNPSPGGRSWPWGPRMGTLAVAYRYYGDRRLGAALQADPSPTSRGGRTLPYAWLAPAMPAAPAILTD
jgi:hypothetical protein